MEIDVFEQLNQIAQAFGIAYYRYQPQDTVQNDADQRLYRILGIESEFKKTVTEVVSLCDEGTLYIVADRYQRYGMAFLCGTDVVVQGPFVVDTTEEILPGVMETNQIPVIFQKELQEYYNSLPLIKDLSVLEKLVMMNMRYLLDESIEITRVYIQNYGDEDVIHYNELQLLEENKISMETIEGRYKIEERLIEAIRSGNIEKVLETEAILSNYRLAPGWRVSSGMNRIHSLY